MEQGILTQPLFAEVQADEERQGETYCKITSEDMKITRRPEVIQIVLRSRFWSWSKLDNSSMLFRSRME